ncbi:MAG: MoxR family ATPase [Saprospiraceae bacterium]|nr:AAA family ATPase [Lewinella sp.]
MKNYPTGARALLIALQTPGLKPGQIGIPVLLWGRPGVGKSSFMEGLASPDFPVLTLIASIHDPTDFSGLPVHHEGKVHYAIPEWINRFEENGNGLLFLDELTTAPPSVQAALLRVVLERKVGFHPLPPQVRIVAAANPPDLMTGGWELSPPLRNRFVHLQWDLPAETYLSALESGFPTAEMPEIDPQAHAELLPEWKLKVSAFLKRSPNSLHTAPDSDPYAFASPRSWDFVATLLASCQLLGEAPVGDTSGSIACMELLKGCLGEGTAIPFLEFLKNLRLPDPEEVLDGKIAVNIGGLNDSEIYVLFGGLNRILQQRFGKDNLLSSTFIYFDLIKDIFNAGQRDLIYVSLRQISREGLLMKAMAAAQQKGPEASKKIMAVIQDIFTDEGLKEFINIFEQ